MNNIPSKLHRRLGKFHVTLELLEDTAEMLLAQLSPHIFTVRCEALWHMHTLEIIAISPHFDIVDQSELPPLYRAEFEYTETNGTQFVRFTRVTP